MRSCRETSAAVKRNSNAPILIYPLGQRIHQTRALIANGERNESKYSYVGMLIISGTGFVHFDAGYWIIISAGATHFDATLLEPSTNPACRLCIHVHARYAQVRF